MRLYSEAYEQRLPAVSPTHLMEADLRRPILLLKRLDIADVGQCDFLDRPGADRVWRGWGLSLPLSSE